MTRQISKLKVVDTLAALSICLSFLIAWIMIGIPLVEFMWWLIEQISHHLSFDVYEFLEAGSSLCAQTSAIISWGVFGAFIFYLGWRKSLFNKGLMIAHLLVALRFILSFLLGLFHAQSGTDSGTYEGMIIGVIGFVIAMAGLLFIIWPQQHFRNTNLR